MALVANTFTAIHIDRGLGLRARTMVVYVRIQILPIEVVNAGGVTRINVAVADLSANYRAVLGLHQAIVTALPGAALGLLDEQLIEQTGDGALRTRCRCRCESP